MSDETTLQPLTPHERSLLTLRGDRDCVRVNPQRFIDPDGPEHERSVFTTVQLGLNHEAFMSGEMLILGPLEHELGVPLSTFTIRPGTRRGHSHFNEDLPDFDHTTIYARYGGSGITAEQFEIMWYFEELAQDRDVPGMSEAVMESVLNIGCTSRPSARYNESLNQWEYTGWTQTHFKAFFAAYKAIKISQGGHKWVEVEVPPPLSPKTNARFLEALNPRETQRDTAGTTAKTLDQMIAERKSRDQKRFKKLTRQKPRRGIDTGNPKNRVAKVCSRRDHSMPLLLIKPQNTKDIGPVARPASIYGGGGTARRRQANMPNPRHRHTGGARGRRNRPALTKEQLDLQLDAIQSAREDRGLQQDMDIDD